MPKLKITPAFGDRVKDKLTGFTGIVTGKVEYITGCTQYIIQPQVSKDKEYELPTGAWMDEDRLEITEPNAVTIDVQLDGPCDPAPIK